MRVYLPLFVLIFFSRSSSTIRSGFFFSFISFNSPEPWLLRNVLCVEMANGVIKSKCVCDCVIANRDLYEVHGKLIST